MGCDIHLHIEVMVGGKWEHYAAPNVGRWYKLFGIMAGVRGDGPAIVAPKGFPNDASELTKILRKDYGSDGHTDSWLDHNEIMALEGILAEWRDADDQDGRFAKYDLEHGILHTYLAGNSFTAHWRYDDFRYLPEGIDDVRFVFWFDN